MMKGDLIKSIESVKWQKLVSRPSALLFSSICAEAFGEIEKSIGLEWRVTDRLVMGDGQLYHSKEEIKAFWASIKEHDNGFFQSYLKKLKEHIGAYDKQSILLESINFSHHGTEELAAELERFLHYAKLAHNFMTTMPIVEKVLAEKVRPLLPGEDKDKEVLLDQLTFGRKFGQLLHEDESFFRLAGAYERGDENYQKLLDDHVRNFGWIGTRSYRWDKAWTKSDIEKRIMSFFVMGDNVEKKKKEHERLKARAANLRDNLLASLGIKDGSELAESLNLVSDYSYLRKWRTDIIYLSGYRARGLFYEIALRANTMPNNVVWLCVNEIKNMLREGKMPVSKKEIADRKEFFAHIMIDGEVEIVAGKSWQKKLDKQMSDRGIRSDLIEFKGNRTCPGIVRGKVKIIKRMKDIEKVDIGDIMVSTMTFPNFVPAMERAAAFITDEGGILSHAAIVSREMNKPCITGTFVGTKVLKDGDLVEVDANNGVVKIIK